MKTAKHLGEWNFHGICKLWETKAKVVWKYGDALDNGMETNLRASGGKWVMPLHIKNLLLCGGLKKPSKRKTRTVITKHQTEDINKKLWRLRWGWKELLETKWWIPKPEYYTLHWHQLSEESTLDCNQRSADIPLPPFPPSLLGV